MKNTENSKLVTDIKANNSQLGGATIIGDCLASFTQAITPQDRQDIENALLYAEMEASTQYDRKKAGKQWFIKYCTALVDINFAPRSMVTRKPLVVSNTRELREQTVYIVGRESPRLAQLVNQTYGALGLDEFAKDFFKGNSIEGTAGLMRVAPCEVIDPNTVSMFLCAMHYETNTTYKDYFFWEEITRRVEIVPDGGQFVFDRNKFNVYREPVRRKIAEHQNSYLRRLDIRN